MRRGDPEGAPQFAQHGESAQLPRVGGDRNQASTSPALRSLAAMEETWIDRLISEATERGELEPHEGVGEPIPNLDKTYDPIGGSRAGSSVSG